MTEDAKWVMKEVNETRKQRAKSSKGDDSIGGANTLFVTTLLYPSGVQQSPSRLRRPQTAIKTLIARPKQTNRFSLPKWVNQ